MILNFRTQKQLLDNWCWAAVASSISFYYHPGSRWRQSTLAGTMIDSQCSTINQENATVAPSHCDRMLDLANVLQATGNFAGEIARPLQFNEIITQINHGWPVCCQLLWPGFIASHFVTIYGYTGNNIIIGDPQAGVFTIDYQEFATNYRNGGRWQRSYGTQSVQQHV